MMSNRALKRWIWKSGRVLNMRDLGGYACEGGMTKYGVVLRSDQLCGLTADERAMLKSRGLTDIIDLRSEGERDTHKNDFVGDPDVAIHTITVGHTKDAMQFSPADYSCMGEMYIEMADANGRQYTDMVRAAAQAKGMVIVHCMAGKDRTGIVCALILLALGVCDADVVADYQISETNQHHEDDERYLTANPEIPRYLMRSEPANMRMLIAHLNGKYGGALAYLKRHGLSGDDLALLKQRMVEMDGA